ncbi:hypothetical protein HON86_01725 [Candidatus Woesearchaeota archaeon]|jgi:hypothetical protein|nr:hypothetical protein [Candidatus Woesearchaeota archaeon]MBT6735250.1 hypothetical protein [Candidatus Woesearchaeota archaeon]MBT7169702.1 hypothetical protein [Candidatus Woesearchaeota archaeon]MBT7474912.1 hypothetical protein [Candidatus Woesearchaeota archaeon]
MNNKIIGIVIGILILGIVIFSGMNNPEMSPSMLNVRDKFESTGLTNPDVIELDESIEDEGAECWPQNGDYSRLNCPTFTASCDSGTWMAEHGAHGGYSWNCN